MEEQEIKEMLRYFREDSKANNIFNGKILKSDGSIPTEEDLIIWWRVEKLDRKVKSYMYIDPLDPKHYNQDLVYPDNSIKD